MARIQLPKVMQKVVAKPASTSRGGEPALVERVTRYLREVRAELQRVNWPSRQELVASTVVVIVVLAVFSLYLGAWDLLFTYIFQRVLGK